MNATEKITRIKEIVAELAAMFPGHRVDLDHCGTTYPTLWVFGHDKYVEATETLRALGCGKRTKTPSQHSTHIEGEVDGLLVKAVSNGLPPTCRLEKRTRRIPKTEVVTLADQFIDVEETVVICDGGNDDDAKLQ